MKKVNLFLLTVTMALLSSNLWAQDGGIDIGYVSIINLGDGRMYHRNLLTDEPLQGQQRIIDGVKSEYKVVNFTDGLYDGHYAYYRNNKLQEEGFYEAGRKQGVFKEYYSDGQTVKRSREYADGKLDGMDRSYFTNGQPDKEKGYRGSVEHGPERRWDQTGLMIVDKNYKDGKLDGPCMERITNNVSSYTVYSNYKRGVLDGEYKEVFEDGTVRKKGMYSDGQRVGQWEENNRTLNDDGSTDTRRVRR